MKKISTGIKANFALGLVCLIWGTTYFAIKIGIEGMSPFAFLGIRHFSAGIILCTILAFFRNQRKYFKWENIKFQILPGILLIGVGNGMIGIAEQYIPTNLVAIIFALIPIYVLCYNIMINKNFNVGKYGILGIAIGLFGVMLIMKKSFVNDYPSGFIFGLVIAFICSFSWAAGGIVSKSLKQKSSVFVNTTFQLLSGGLFLLILSVAFEDFKLSSLDFYSNAGISLIYLILIGSLLTFLAYVYAVENLPLEKVALHTYINPLVAIILGWLFLSEEITLTTIIATFFILSSVFLTNKSLKKRTAKNRKD